VQEDDRVGLCWSALDEVPSHRFAVAWRIYEAVHRPNSSQHFDVAVIVRCRRLNGFQPLDELGDLREAIRSRPDVIEAARLVAKAVGRLSVGVGNWHDGSP
jgi:hypothetical protein